MGIFEKFRPIGNHYNRTIFKIKHSLSSLMRTIPERNTRHYVGLEVLRAALMKSSIFWDIMPHSLLKVNQRFRGTCCLHLQGQRISQAWNQHEGLGLMSVLVAQWRTKIYNPVREASYNLLGSRWWDTMTYLDRNPPPIHITGMELKSQLPPMMMWSMYLGLVERMVVWYSWMQFPKLILCSAMVELSRCSRWISW
jgi:hypothetical protein